MERMAPCAIEQDWVAVEEPLELRLAGDPLATTLRTPGEDHKLALGFLFAEGIIHSARDVDTLRHCGNPQEEGYGNVLDVLPAPGVRLSLERVLATRRGTITTASCGVCGRQSITDLCARLSPLKDVPPLPLAALTRAPDLLREKQRGFSKTGGTHGAAVLDATGRVLAAHEDVGRHNATDKAVGELLLKGELPARGTSREARILVVSGRAGFEIVQKAAVASIPYVVSVSAPSSLAIDLAHRMGLTLAGFARAGALNLYTHASRVLDT
jgi:FdhD protein